MIDDPVVGLGSFAAPESNDLSRQRSAWTASVRIWRERSAAGWIGASWRVLSAVMDHVGVARCMPPARYAQPAGAKIAYRVSGEGPCDLVFVPGLVSQLELAG